jgi:hypothetical protein
MKLHEIYVRKHTNPAVWMRVIPVRHQKSFFCRSETKPPRRTTVVQVTTNRPNPRTPIIRYPMNTAYPLIIITSIHLESSTAYWLAILFLVPHKSWGGWAASQQTWLIYSEASWVRLTIVRALFIELVLDQQRARGRLFYLIRTASLFIALFAYLQRQSCTWHARKS